MYEIVDLDRAAERFTSRVRDLVEVLPRDDLAGQALSVELEYAHRRFLEAWKDLGGAAKGTPATWAQVEKSTAECLRLIELLWRTQMLHPPRVLQILAHGKAFADAVAKSRRQSAVRRPAPRRRGGGGR